MKNQKKYKKYISTSKKKDNTLFLLLGDITGKGDYLENNEEKASKISPFIVNRFLSMNPRILPLVNEIQQYIGCLGPLQYFSLLKGVVPKNKGFHKYIKNEDGRGREIYQWLARYYKVSEKMAIMYNRLLSENETIAILRKFGESTRFLLKRMGVKDKKKKERSLKDYGG